MGCGILLRAYAHRRQEWLTGADAVPVMLARSRQFLYSLTRKPVEYCKATRTRPEKLPAMIAQVRLEIDLLEKLL